MSNMKKRSLTLLIILSATSAFARNTCDYNLAAQKQKELVDKIAKYEIETSSQLIYEASTAYDPADDMEKKLRKEKIKLATERFMKHEYLSQMSVKMESDLYMVKTLDSFKSFHENSQKTKFYLKGSAQIFKAWMKGMVVNTLVMKNLKTELRNELIEAALKNLIGDSLPDMTSEEALLITYITDISVKAGMDITSKLLAGQAIRYGGTEMFLGWAGGPIGVALMVAPLFMSGTLPYETRWTDLTEKNPELVLNPELMVQAGITNDPKHALEIHCWAWTRRGFFMEKRGDQIIAKEKKKLARHLKLIKEEPLRRAEARRSLYARRDNTYVKPPIILDIRR